MRKSLEVAIPSGLKRAGNVELLNVNIASSDSPFAVVNYSVYGKKQELGLRLNLDKQVFLDKTGDPRVDDDLQNRAVDVVDVVSRSLDRSGRTPRVVSRRRRESAFFSRHAAAAQRLPNRRASTSRAVADARRGLKLT